MSELKILSKEQFEEAVQRNINISKKDEKGIINAISVANFDIKENPYIYSAILSEVENKSLDEIINGNQISASIISSAKIKAQKYYDNVKKEELNSKKNDKVYSEITEEKIQEISDTYNAISDLFKNLTEEQKEQVHKVFEVNEVFNNYLQEFFDYLSGKIDKISDEALKSDYGKLFGNPPDKEKIKAYKNDIDILIATYSMTEECQINSIQDYQKINSRIKRNGSTVFSKEEEKLKDKLQFEVIKKISRNPASKNKMKEELEGLDFFKFNVENNKKEEGKNYDETSKIVSIENCDKAKAEEIDDEYMDSILEEIEWTSESSKNEVYTDKKLSDLDFEKGLKDSKIQFEEVYCPNLENVIDSINIQKEFGKESNPLSENPFSLDEIMDQTSQFVKITSVKREEDLIKGIVEYQHTGEKGNETVEIN